MKLAADLTGLKNNLLNRNREEPESIRLPDTPNTATRPNFQIFRLIRAAQMHYLRPGGDTNPSSETDLVNNSREQIEEEEEEE